MFARSRGNLILLLASQLLCHAAVVALPAATAAESTGGEPQVWLVKNNWKHGKGLPKNFRKLNDSTDELGKSLTKGLEALNASGSAQYSKGNVEAIRAAIGQYKITIVDLRQEPHGFVNKELPISWYQGQDQLNWGKSFTEIETDESKRLYELQQEKSALFFDLIKPVNNPTGPKVGAEPEKLEITSTCDEASICKSEHLKYVRLPVADYHAPSDEYVEKFVKLVKNSSADEWLHLHSGMDNGRTTTFLAMYDMIKNADKVSFDKIIERQQMLGGIDLLQTSPKQDLNGSYMEARAKFIREFYKYCLEQAPSKFASSWSDWKRNMTASEKK